ASGPVGNGRRRYPRPPPRSARQSSRKRADTSTSLARLGLRGSRDHDSGLTDRILAFRTLDVGTVVCPPAPWSGVARRGRAAGPGKRLAAKPDLLPVLQESRPGFVVHRGR